MATALSGGVGHIISVPISSVDVSGVGTKVRVSSRVETAALVPLGGDARARLMRSLAHLESPMRVHPGGHDSPSSSTPLSSSSRHRFAGYSDPTSWNREASR